jgi:hypothetical protein
MQCGRLATVVWCAGRVELKELGEIQKLKIGHDGSKPGAGWCGLRIRQRRIVTSCIFHPRSVQTEPMGRPVGLRMPLLCMLARLS